MCLDKFQPVIPLGSYDAFSSLWCFSLLKYGLDFFPFTPDIYWGGLQKVCFCQFLAEYLCHLWARGKWGERLRLRKTLNKQSGSLLRGRCIALY